MSLIFENPAGPETFKKNHIIFFQDLKKNNIFTWLPIITVINVILIRIILITIDNIY